MSKRAPDSAPATRGSVIHWARLYDFATGLLGAGSRSGIRAATVDRAELRPGESVLDVGCGPGVLTLLAKERVGPSGDVHGIDASPEMIARARTKAANARVDVRFQTAVIEELPFADGSFDVVLSSLMLHHLPDDVKREGFSQIARVLRPGGRLLAFDLSGEGSLLWRLMSLVGHRLPATYGSSLENTMRGAGLSPERLATHEKQYITILARKPG